MFELAVIIVCGLAVWAVADFARLMVQVRRDKRESKALRGWVREQEVRRG